MVIFRDVGLNWPAWPVQLTAIAIVLGVLILRRDDWSDRNVRLQFLGFVLVFCVVFNHRAERQSAVIALCGMVIWYLSSPRSAWRTALFAVVYFLVGLTGATLMPHAIKRILAPEVRFSIPLTILWLVMLFDLVIVRKTGSAIAETR